MHAVFVPCAVFSLNDASQKGHWAPRAAIRHRIRDSARIVGIQSLSTGELVAYCETPVQIIVTPYECRTKITDAGNAMASTKAAIDGLRDAGVIVDDSPRYVKALTFIVGTRVTRKQDEGLQIMFREWQR